MFCKNCNKEVQAENSICPLCNTDLSIKPMDEQDIPVITPNTNNMLSPKFLVVILIAICFIVLVKNIFFKNVEKMPKYKMDYGIDIVPEVPEKK